MDEIKELVHHVSKHKIKQIDILDQSLDPESKMGRYYELLRSTDMSDDDLAIELGYESSSDRSFHRLRNRFKKRLINTIFFIDVNQPTYTDYQKAYNTTYKDWGAVRLLLFRGARQTSMALAQTLIKIAQRYHFSDIVLVLSKDLRNHYAQQAENVKEYEKYNFLFNKYSQYFFEEARMENEYNKVKLLIKQATKKSMSKINDSLYQTYKNNQGLLGSIPTYRYNLTSYYCLATILDHLNKYEDVLKLNEEARNYFNTLPFTSPIVINLISQQDALAYLKLKKYNQALDSLNVIKDIPEPGSLNWYYPRIYLSLTYLHIKNYDQAWKVVEECIENRHFTNLMNTFKQFIYIIQAYLEFINQSLELGFNSNFRLGRFLNDVPEYSKDKRGLNISILIVHFLFLIEQKKYFDAIDRVEALNQYCYRYLKKDDNFRSNAFIKMLIQVTKADFHPVRSKRYAQKYYEKLLSTPLEMADQPLDVEIVPYEHLWEVISDLLAKNN